MNESVLLMYAPSTFSTSSMAEGPDLLRSVEAVFRDTDNHVLMAFRVSKRRPWGVPTRKSSGGSAKQRVFALTNKLWEQLISLTRKMDYAAKRLDSVEKLKVSLQVLKISSHGFEPAKVYKLEHLIKIEVVPNDSLGCTFILCFNDLKNRSVAVPQWTMRNIDDRNKFLICTLNLCQENLGRSPKIVGMDMVELALWAQENAKTIESGEWDNIETPISVNGSKQSTISMEKDFVSQAEEDDMEALLATYVMGINEPEAFSERLKRELLALEAANVHAIIESQPLVDEVLLQLTVASSSVDDLDEWLRILNTKLKYMREDIEWIEIKNSQLEIEAHNNVVLLEELNKLLDRLKIPEEYLSSLTVGSFEEARMPQNMEACEWLTQAMRFLELPHLDPCYMNMRAVKEKRVELEKLKSTFVKRATEFLRNYFSGLVDFMINDKTYFSMRGQSKRPDHADLRFKCLTYARLLQHLKNLDKSSLIPLREAYCRSLNLLLRREAREFGSELRTSTKTTRNMNAGGAWLEGSGGGGSNNGNRGNGSNDTSAVSDAYAKMLKIFIPLLVDESTFFASFMCFDVLPLVPPGTNDRGDSEVKDGSDLGAPTKTAQDESPEIDSLNQALERLLDGIQEDFFAVVEWSYKTDPIRCISLQGATEHFLSSQKADAAGWVRKILLELQSKIKQCFNRFIDEACSQIKNHSNARQIDDLRFIYMFNAIAQRMESLVQGNSRDMVDEAYVKVVGTMFNVFEKVAQMDPKRSDIILLEYYATFQNSMYELANAVPLLGSFYHTASDNYEQARTRYINSVINYQFEKLFQFGEKVEALLYTVQPEEVSYHEGFSKADVRKLLKASLAGADKCLFSMYKRMQKQIISEELLPYLWVKCKDDFLEKYEALEAVLTKCYPDEALVPSSTEMANLFKRNFNM